MKHKVTIKAEGDNASGKSYLLTKIKDFLEEQGFEIDDDSLKDKHEIVVVNEYQSKGTMLVLEKQIFTTCTK